MASSDNAAPGTTRRQTACVACSRAKRKCSKQLPACRRRRVQKLRCAYPVTVARVMLPHSPPSFTQSATQSRLDLSVHEDVLPARHRNIPSADVSTAVDLGQVIDHVAAPWFLEPSSWEIDHVHIEDDRITYPDSGLDYFLDHVRTWLDQWQSENHCAFVHSMQFHEDNYGRGSMHGRKVCNLLNYERSFVQ